MQFVSQKVKRFRLREIKNSREKQVKWMYEISTLVIVWGENVLRANEKFMKRANIKRVKWKLFSVAVYQYIDHIWFAEFIPRSANRKSFQRDQRKREEKFVLKSKVFIVKWISFFFSVCKRKGKRKKAEKPRQISSASIMNEFACVDKTNKRNNLLNVRIELFTMYDRCQCR